jgi:hypothetical protein
MHSSARDRITAAGRAVNCFHNRKAAHSVFSVTNRPSTSLNRLHEIVDEPLVAAHVTHNR